ncbi:TetR/AcrR family transcriptional regulator [Clostridium sp. MSJ-4]|uniref:TetR/AcrR family transcriptional regulator n=1 Tax=Clostridium simiarum TaxID=2841506 RepID=A0ABS6F4Q3_9CLOT|nr:TetR/AcrR family transcriptional regulator [Clostridium simiarum]MBU5593380.1 TetR/AcrR family transcriptional regulator [Clostridium simiarum]
MNKTKRVIFEASIKIFSKKGYEGATMDDIAATAGVAKGTLYYHFKSKEEIFNYIIKEGMHIIKEDMVEETEKEDNAILKLRTLCRIQLESVYKYRDFFKVVMSQIWGQEIRQLELREALSDYISTIEIYLKEASEKGVLKKGDSSFMAHLFLGILMSASMYELLNADDPDIDEISDSLMNYILRGIEA